ncbi:hypothetical protein [Hungatella effluvii]|uniref:hypothetical protein n=1 Tax=Hungatella effluvii TaxID=1096246 RepID=UPI0022E3CE4B|nr:hypothetical protein [Hungatella effluvii]
MIKVLVVSMLMILTTLAVGITAYAGNWQITNYGWWYQSDDGTFPTNQWFQDTNGKWYHFNSDGYIQYGWLNDNGRWYYLSEDGSMIKDSWKKINGKSYYFGSDGALYVNTTTPDGVKVNENGERIKSLSIRSIIGNKYVLETDLETYQWWEEHGEEVRNDSRIKGSAVEMANLVSEFYPQIPGHGSWYEFSFENDYWDSDSCFGVGGHGQGGEIIWKETTALLKMDYETYSHNVKIIDENTIEIDGDIFIKVSK